MATSKKVIITSVMLNNKAASTPVPSQSVDTEIIDGVVQPEMHITKPGVVYTNQPSA